MSKLKGTPEKTKPVKQTRFGLVVSLLFIISLVYEILTFAFAYSKNSTAIGMQKVAIGVGCVWIIDKYAMKGIDTLEKLRKGDVGYAIYFLGICILVGLVLHAT